MSSRPNQHPSTHAFKLSYVSHEKPVEENRSSRWINRYLDNGRHLRKRSRQRFLHGHSHDFLLSGLEENSLGKILIAILAHGDHMFARQQQDFLRSLEFLQIADVLPVDPDSGAFFDVGLSFELNLSHHTIFSARNWAGE